MLQVIFRRDAKEFEETQPKPVFFRVYQSNLVNLQHIKKVVRAEGDHVIMADGKQIPISRRRKEEFMQIVLGEK